MRVLFALSGFHRYDRGAEIALLSIARVLQRDGIDITVAGGGPTLPETCYDYVECSSPRRERFEKLPNLPGFRNETAYEDLFFSLSLARRVKFDDFDATVTCAYPYTNWALRKCSKDWTKHIFVTQNGDWPAFSNDWEFRLFDCDRLVCTNPIYHERNASNWECALIPNGIDIPAFKTASDDRMKLGLPQGPIVLMVSAMIESKRVLDGVRIMAELPEATLVVAGDGPLRSEVDELAQDLIPGRYLQVTLPSDLMPTLYRSCDVFLHLSHNESFGNVFLEAWASGLPIVAHDSPGLRWIVGDAQFLLDTRDLKATRTALQQALTVKGSYIPAGIERFSWNEVGKQYQALLEDLL